MSHLSSAKCTIFAVFRRHVRISGITELDVAESIINAVAIYKRLRSRSPFRGAGVEYLYVIQATNLEGLMIYSKGKLVSTGGGKETFYFLISSKRAV